MKTIVDKSIRRFADKFGIEFRVGRNPAAVNIVTKPLPDKVVAAYFGQGVIFVKDQIKMTKQADVNFLLCHEIAHAMFDFYHLKTPQKIEECSANMGALIIMAHLNLTTSAKMLRAVGKYNRSKKLFLNWKEI